MGSSVAGVQTENYQINTEEFEGPLDLLLDLIERAQLDITRLALAQVTEQFLSYIRALEEKDAAEVSAFLIIAAKLIQIKSEALLPRPPQREVVEEDPAESLAQQLIIYRRFKRAAEWLGAREHARLRSFLHMAPLPKFDTKQEISGLSLEDLLSAARLVYSPEVTSSPLSRIISLSNITIRDKIRFIIDRLHRDEQHSFFLLLGNSRSRADVVVLFLAMLELIKRRIVEARQDQIFSDIVLEPMPETSPPSDLDLDLEFDD